MDGLINSIHQYGAALEYALAVARAVGQSDDQHEHANQVNMGAECVNAVPSPPQKKKKLGGRSIFLASGEQQQQEWARSAGRRTR